MSKKKKQLNIRTKLLKEKSCLLVKRLRCNYFNLSAIYYINRISTIENMIYWIDKNVSSSIK